MTTTAVSTATTACSFDEFVASLQAHQDVAAELVGKTVTAEFTSWHDEGDVVFVEGIVTAVGDTNGMFAVVTTATAGVFHAVDFGELLTVAA